MNYATISTCKNCVIGYRGVRVTNNTVIPPVSRYLKHFPPEWILAIMKIACIQDNLSSRALGLAALGRVRARAKVSCIQKIACKIR